MEDVIESIDALFEFCPTQWPEVPWERSHIEEAVAEALRRLAQRLDHSARLEKILPSGSSIEIDGCALVLKSSDIEPKHFINFDDIIAHLSACCNTHGLSEIGKELDHCIRSEALSILYCRFVWPLSGPGNARKVWDTVGRNVQDAGALVMLEQLAAFYGHPTHPMWKTRTPLTSAESCSYAPEFGDHVVPLVLAARTTIMTIFPSVEEWKAIWEQEFPLAFELLAENVDQEQLHEYVPLFVHPLNERTLRERFASAFASRDLFIIKQQAYHCRATLSFRTLSVSGRYHVKLPVPVQSTSWPRYVSPVEAHESAIVTKLLHRMELPADLIILEERFTCHASFGTDFTYRDCSYCSMILRESPLLHVRSGCRIFPLASLFATAGEHEHTLWQLLWNEHGLDADGSLPWFRCYSAKVTTIQVSFFMRYGFTIEAHQQNTALEFDEKGQLTRMIYKEIGGGIEIDAERLAAFPDLDFSRELHPNQDMIVAGCQCIALLRHSMLQSHLLPLAKLTSKTFSIPLDAFITVVCDEIEKAIAATKQAPGDTWSEERFHSYGADLMHALLGEAECTCKALLRMRLAGSKDYVFTRVPNPFFR